MAVYQKLGDCRMNEPLVSVLMCVYNAGGFLRDSVESILRQSYDNLEVIIIDDGSSDNCLETIADIRDLRLRIIAQRNVGKGAALNRAVNLVKGEFYAIQDADDISYPQRIERQVQCMLEHPEVATVFTGNDIILNGRRIAPRFAAKTIAQCRYDISRIRMPAHDPTGMFRMSMVKDFLYNPELKIGIGLEYILRLGARFQMMLIGECLYSYRVHRRSLTRGDPAKRKRAVREILSRACRRSGLDPDKHLPKPRNLSRVSHRDYESGIVVHFMESVLDLRRAGRRWQAMKTAIACLGLHPCDWYYYKPLVYFFTPSAVIAFYRSRKAVRETRGLPA